MMDGNSDQGFLATIQRSEPVSVQELCEAIGVTATAVRQRLLRLQAEGVVERQISRQERGRPHYTYALTPAGAKLLSNDQGEMAVVLWREVMRIGQRDVREQVLNGVKEALVQRFGTQPRSQSLAGRLQGMCSELSAFGFDVECLLNDGDAPGSAGETGSAEEHKSRKLPLLREHSCPYREIAAEDSSFCELEASVYSEILQVPVELSACRLEGHRCCEFQVGAADQI